jgi:ATP phosphoribosyltransferase regulatory subunit
MLTGPFLLCTWDGIMGNQATAAERPLPEGVRDLLFADTAAFRRMEAALHATWEAWGYREISPPTFEYASTLATEVGAQVDAELYRFFDRHGHTLALRADMTIPTARIVGTRLHDQPMPLRLAYSGSVFRHEQPRAGRQHEFAQAGVELVGAPGACADAEVVALAVAALRAVGLPNFGITLGHIGFFRGLLAALALPQSLTARLQEAVGHKAEAELAGLLGEAPALPPIARQAVINLPRLSGSAGVLDSAEAICLNATMMNALSELRAVARMLQAYGVAQSVTYDLAEVRDLNYYTGITFEGFAPGLGFGVIGGGRYDDLISHFGPRLPAVGWALTLDRVLLARELQGISEGEPRPDILLAAQECAHCLAWAAVARSRGLKVEVDLLGLQPDALWQAAQARRIARTVRHADAALITVRDMGGERTIAADDWEEVARWRNG